MKKFRVVYIGCVGLRETIARSYDSEKQLRDWWELTVPNLAIQSITEITEKEVTPS